MRKLAALFFVAFAAAGQTQAHKDWDLDRHASLTPEQRDGSLDDPAILDYVERIERSIAGQSPLEVRVTRGKDHYAVSRTRLYLSAGLLAKIENEAELAGLFAHVLAHARARTGCVLGSPAALRDQERRATADALSSLKAAGYDPAGLLDLFSRLAYEHPAWARAIAPEDLLEFRVALEREPLPPAGYRVDSSAFHQLHGNIEAVLAEPSTAPALSRRRSP